MFRCRLVLAKVVVACFLILVLFGRHRCESKLGLEEAPCVLGHLLAGIVLGIAFPAARLEVTSKSGCGHYRKLLEISKHSWLGAARRS